LERDYLPEAIAISRDNSVIAVAKRQTHVFDAETGKLLQIIDVVMAAAF
jgi:hypothetical protein